MGRKKEGIVGRSSKQTIEKRRRICLELYNSRPNLTQKNFIRMYAQILRNNKMDVPTDQTLMNDIKKLELSFRNVLQTSNPIKTSFRNMGHKIKYCLRQIRIGYIFNDIVLYNSDSSLKISSKDDFSKVIAKLKDSTDFTAITDTSLVCLSFILNEKGFETYIEDVFNKYLKIICNYLYSETQNYCTKIFFEYQQLDTMMDYVYQTISVLNV